MSPVEVLSASPLFWHLENVWNCWNIFLFKLLFLGLSLFGEIFFILSNSFLEVFGQDMLDLAGVPLLIEAVDISTGIREILMDLSNLLDSLGVSGALIMVPEDSNEVVSNTNKIHAFVEESIEDLGIHPETLSLVVEAPVHPNVTNLIELAVFLVLPQAVNDKVSSFFSHISSDLVLVLLVHLVHDVDVVEDWLGPLTKASVGDDILLMMVHSSNRGSVGLTKQLSDDLLVLELV